MQATRRLEPSPASFREYPEVLDLRMREFHLGGNATAAACALSALAYWMQGGGDTLLATLRSLNVPSYSVLRAQHALESERRSRETWIADLMATDAPFYLLHPKSTSHAQCVRDAPEATRAFSCSRLVRSASEIRKTDPVPW